MTTTASARVVNEEFDIVVRSCLAKFEELLERNGKLWEPDQYPHQFASIIEQEVIPALQAIEDYDPTPDTPYDFFH